MQKIYQIVMFIESNHYDSPNEQYVVAVTQNKSTAEKILNKLNKFYNHPDQYNNYLSSYINTLIGKTNFDTLWDKLSYNDEDIFQNMKLIDKCFDYNEAGSVVYAVTKIEVNYKYLHGEILSGFEIVEQDLI